MSSNELYNLGVEAYDKEQYEEALSYFQKASADEVEAQSYIPLCYLNIATEVSCAASNSNDTETLVRGQQKAVALLDAAMRTALKFIKEHPESKSNCNVAGMVISTAFNLQYTLVATGLTTAYRLTQTTTTIERTKMGDTVLWEEIVGKDTEQYVSLVSYDMHDYHIFGPDEKTKRVAEQKRLILHNAVQVASILTYLGREHDAHMLRASVACEMADCENGDRSMLMAADWFIWQAQDIAKDSVPEEEYKEWKELNDSTINSYMELEAKYNALLRSFKREGRQPALAVFYQAGESVPSVDSCVSYKLIQEANQTIDQGTSGRDIWEIFLSIYAQAATVRAIPTIVFSSVISLLMGGLFNVLSSDFNIFGIVWLVITFIITFVRSLTDSAGISGKNLRIYQLIMFGIGIVFSINFFVGLIAFFVLRALASKYK